MTEQPPSQPSDEPQGDAPAELAPHEATAPPAAPDGGTAEQPAPPASPDAGTAEQPLPPASLAPDPATGEPPTTLPATPAPAFGTTQPGPTPYDSAPAAGGGGSLVSADVPGGSGLRADVPGGSALPADRPGGSGSPADRPEIAVGAAFAGGLLLALILKRLAR